jgi:Hg(II)-responsive transcriptional regulator
MTARECDVLIGQVAAAGGVAVGTIRYYERRGLLPSAGRSPSGYRKYSRDAVKRLRFIRHAQDLGFSLEEIRELLALRVRDSASCNAVAQRTRRKIDLVEQRIRDLKRLQRTLKGLEAACAARRTTEPCPILAALEDHAVGSE